MPPVRFALLVLLAGLLRAAPDSLVTSSLVYDTTRNVYQLPDTLIAAGSETLRCGDSLLVRGTHYRISYPDGTVRFITPLAPGCRIDASYRRLPFNLQRVYFRREMVTAPAESLVRVVPRRQARPWERFNRSGGKEDLDIWGSKTFGLAVGSERDLALEQALDLHIHGRIADKVDVTASLSDQNTPIPPEGNTQVLREIDGVMIKIAAPNAGVSMGDLAVDYTGTRYAAYSKRLEGAQGYLDFDRLDASVCVAAADGEYRSYTFQGSEGVQGPYLLTDKEGGTGIRVLAGSEQVWVDGEKMVRGSSNDYVIEYGDGSIEFTGRRLITAASRVTVDYEYSREDYRKNFYSGEMRFNLWRKKVTGTLIVAGERDDGENPLDFVMDDTARTLLAAAGDDAAAAMDSAGAVWADTVTGRYYYRGDTLVGTATGTGTHDAVFSYLGPGKGDYDYDALSRRYRYVGKNNGSYLPVRLLTLPKQHLVTGAVLTAAPAAWVRARAEGALSVRDENILSGRDDDDNLGWAYYGRLQLVPGDLRPGGLFLGTPRVEGGYEYRHKRFVPLGRVDEALAYDRQWNMTVNGLLPLEKLDVAADYGRGDGLQAGYSAGRLWQGTVSDRVRQEVRASTGRKGWPRVEGTWQRVESDDSGEAGTDAGTSAWEKTEVKAAHDFPYLAPGASLYRERYRGTLSRSVEDTLATGYTVTKYTASLALRGVAGGRLAGSVDGSVDETGLDGETYVRAVTGRMRSAVRDAGALNHRLEITRRQRTVYDAGRERDRTETWLATTDNEFAPLGRALVTGLQYEVTSMRTAPKTVIYDSIGYGYGTHRRDITPYGDTLYIPDADGDYLERFVTIGDFVPTVEVKNSCRLEINPGRLQRKNNKPSRAGRVLGLLRSVSRFTLDKTALAGPDDLTSVYLPVFGGIDTATVRRETKTFRQDLYVTPSRQRVELRLQYRWTRTEDWEYFASGLDRVLRERGARLRVNRIGPVDTETAYINRQRTEHTGVEKYDGHGHEVSTTLFRRYPRLYVSVKGTFTSEEDAETGIASSLYAVKPSANYTLGPKGRLNAELEAAMVTDSTASYRQLDGYRQGSSFSWNLLFDYRVNTYVTYYISYNGSNEPWVGDDRRTVHQGRAEVRATF